MVGWRDGQDLTRLKKYTMNSMNKFSCKCRFYHPSITNDCTNVSVSIMTCTKVNI